MLSAVSEPRQGAILSFSSPGRRSTLRGSYAPDPIGLLLASPSALVEVVALDVDDVGLRREVPGGRRRQGVAVWYRKIAWVRITAIAGIVAARLARSGLLNLKRHDIDNYA